MEENKKVKKNHWTQYKKYKNAFRREKHFCILKTEEIYGKKDCYFLKIDLSGYLCLLIEK